MSESTPVPETATDASPESTEPANRSLRARILAALDVDANTSKRAQWEQWEFEVVGPHQIEVTNASWGPEKDQHRYTVGVAERDDLFVPAECACRADRFHDGACKHRVAIAIHGGPPLLGSAVVYHDHDTPDATDPLADETTLRDKLFADGGDA